MAKQPTPFSAPAYLDRLRVVVEFTDHPGVSPVEVWQVDHQWSGAEGLPIDEVVDELRSIVFQQGRFASHVLKVHANETHWGASSVTTTIVLTVTTAILSSAGTEAVKASFSRIGARCRRSNRESAIDAARTDEQGRMIISASYPAVITGDLEIQEETYSVEAGTAKIIYCDIASNSIYTVEFGITKRSPHAVRISRTVK